VKRVPCYESSAGRKTEGLFEARAIPHAERIAISGPDMRSARGRRSRFSLLFFELASHSDEGLSLVGKHPHIVAHWEVNGEDPNFIFHFRWEEFTPARRPAAALTVISASSCSIASRRRRLRDLEAILHRCQLRVLNHRADETGD